LNATVPLVAAAAADNSSLGIILGAVSLGLVGLMGIVMGTNAMRRSGALNFLGALGVKTPPGIATGRPRTKEEIAADAAAKTTVLGRMGTMVTAIKGRSAQITKLVDSLPVPDSVKSFVHDPKSVLPKSAQDLLDTAQNSFGQPSEPADLENTQAPTPKSILKKDSRVTIAPTPTFSDDVVLDGGIQLTNRQPRTQTQVRRPVYNNTTTDDRYDDVYDTDNVDNPYENTLIRQPMQSSSSVRNPGSFGTQRGSIPIKPKIPTPTLPEGCKCEACLAAKAAHEPPPPQVSTADVMKQLEDLKKFMVEQMKPVAPAAPTPSAAPAPAPVTVHVSTTEPAERLPKIVYPENSWSNTPSSTTNPDPTFLKKTTPIVETPAAPAAPDAPVTEVVEAPKVAEASVTEITEAPKVTEETQDPPKATIEVNAHELEEIRALLAERQKKII